MDFEVSATNLAGLMKALEADGSAAKVLSLVSAPTQAILKMPHAQRWHPGAVAVEAWSAIIDAFGAPRLEQLNLLITRQSFGPIVRPLVKVALALGGNSPATVLARLDDAIKVATRNVKVTWVAGGPTAGTVSFEYPRAMPRPDVVEYGWRGAMRFGEELTGKPIRFGAFQCDSDRRFTFPVSW